MPAIGRGHIMDMITEGLLAEFSKEFQVESLPEDKRFENLCGFIVVKRHYSETFDPKEIVVGAGGDLVPPFLRR
jgi:hypothetical protein